MSESQVNIARTRLPIINVTQQDVDSISVSEARSVWADFDGPTSRYPWLLSEPTASTKARKSVVPEYMLYLLPHRLAGRNVCQWSNEGCRKHCLVHSGRGAQPNVRAGRETKTILMHEHPAAFMRLVFEDLRRIEKRHDNNAWVRLNGTADIPWERVLDGNWISDSPLTFADYTKAPAHVRESNPMPNYYLARSVWPERHTAEEIADLLIAGERVSMVVDDPKTVLPSPLAVLADKTDEWLISDGPVLGLLSPKGSLRKDKANVFSNAAAEHALRLAAL